MEFKRDRQDAEEQKVHEAMLTATFKATFDDSMPDTSTGTWTSKRQGEKTTWDLRFEFRLLPTYEIHANLVFQLECYPGLLRNGPTLCKFVSRSDRVLDAEHSVHSLDFLSYLVLQAWVFQREWRASIFALFA